MFNTWTSEALNALDVLQRKTISTNFSNKRTNTSWLLALQALLSSTYKNTVLGTPCVGAVPKRLQLGSKQPDVARF